MKLLSIRLVVVIFIMAHIILGYGCPFVNIVGAQCAWVLWERQHITNEDGKVVNPGDWGIVGAYPRYEQCLERQRQAFLDFKEEQGYKVILRPHEYASRYKEGGKGSILQELKCLPDTIDLRK